MQFIYHSPNSQLLLSVYVNGLTYSQQYLMFSPVKKDINIFNSEIRKNILFLVLKLAITIGTVA